MSYIEQPESRPDSSPSRSADSKPEKLLLTTDEAAHLMGVSKSVMAQLLYTGKVKSLKIGALRRVPVQALYEFIATAGDTAA